MIGWNRYLGIIAAAASFFLFHPCETHAQLSGTLGAHDPSALIKEGNTYRYFATGNGISSRRSTNLTNWSNNGRVFDEVPAWTRTAVPGFVSNFWAPDVAYFNGKYHLYYSVSTFGSQVSAIGMATSPTLDTTSPDYEWIDHGPVIQSQVGSPYNAIDPNIFIDDNGATYMTFGSFWNGIHQVELEPTTGLRKNNNAPIRLASASQIEAPYLHKRDGYYYLFVNWGQCCSGVNSTYNIRVGRSTSPNGPFLARNGADLRNSGGTLFLGTEGNFIGPGHISIFSENGQDLFSYHYYNGAANGAATYNLRPLYWDAAGWPSATFVVPEPAAGVAAVFALLLLKRRIRRAAGISGFPRSALKSAI